jgi:hypothetical protein
MLNAILMIFAGCAAGAGIGLAVIMIALKKRRPAAADAEFPSQTTFAFSGNLKQTPLLEAVQFLEMSRREGVLHIYYGRRKGYLLFKDGKLADGFYRNGTGKESVLSMLELDEGDFYFEPKTVVQPRLINESAMGLAFEFDARKNGAQR